MGALLVVALVLGGIVSRRRLVSAWGVGVAGAAGVVLLSRLGAGPDQGVGVALLLLIGGVLAEMLWRARELRVAQPPAR